MTLPHIIMFGLTAIQPGDLPTTSASENTVKTILQIVFSIVGALALLMITISGLRYITSAGDPQKASKARNGIIFSVAGLAVAIAAEAIVVFVVKRL